MNQHDEIRKIQEAIAVEQQAQAEKYSLGDTCQNMTMGVAGKYDPLPSEEAQKSAAYHRDEMQKAQAATAFLREYPAFDQFIKLVRQGVFRL